MKIKKTVGKRRRKGKKALTVRRKKGRDARLNKGKRQNRTK